MIAQPFQYRKHMMLVAVLLMLTACALPFRAYHIPLQQGNILSEAQIASIKPGMTKTQVLQNLGHPVLLNTFNDRHWHYTYWSKPSHSEATRKNLDIGFQGDRVTRVR